MSPVVADRVRKARKASTLACGCYVRPGHMIARTAGEWVCIEHLLAGREEVTAMPDEDPPDDTAEPVYDAMISRTEDGPDPLVPQPSGVPRSSKKGK